MTTTTGYREDREYRGVTHDVTRVTCRKGKRSWIEHYSIDGNKEVEYLDPEI